MSSDQLTIVASSRRTAASCLRHASLLTSVTCYAEGNEVNMGGMGDYVYILDRGTYK